MREFAADLGAWAKQAGVREVLVLSGADAGKRLPAQMEGSVRLTLMTLLNHLPPAHS